MTSLHQRPRFPQPRRRRRARRQEGAVLFIVLMMVVLSSLAATFAIQDTTYELAGARGLAHAVSARYVAEAGVNTLPSVLSHYRPDDLRALLLANAAANATTFPHSKFNVPPPVGAAYSPFSVEDFDTIAYPEAAQQGVETVTQDARSPFTTRYEAVYEAYCGGSGSTMIMTVSAYGRRSLAWDEEARAYTGDDLKQTGDENHFHDTVSLARSFYTAELISPCGGGSI